MPKLKTFTPRGLAALRPPAAGRLEYWETSLPGFGLRIFASGERVYFVRYRAEGRHRRHKIGTAPPLKLREAREKARRMLKHLQLTGKDPEPRYPTSVPSTLVAIVGRYVEERRDLRIRTAREYRRIVRVYLKGRAAAEKPVRDVKRLDVRGLLDELARERGGPMANHVYLLLRAACRWAVQEQLIERSVVDGVQQPHRQRSRERVLRPEEIRALWLALEDEATEITASRRPFVIAVVRTLLLLGTRTAETMNMRWQDLDLKASPATWTVPGEFRKGGRLVVVPLAGPVVKILECLQPLSGGGPRVFAGINLANRTRNWVTKLKERAVALGVSEDFTLHDLRRTCATGCSQLGASPHVVSRILGHAATEGTIPVTGVYNRYQYLAEKAATLNAWAAHVLGLVQSEGGERRIADVVPIGR